MFSVCLRRNDEVRRYSVGSHGVAGWEIKTEGNRMVTRHVWYHDWHRVERKLALLTREVEDLTEQGWQIQSTESTITTDLTRNSTGRAQAT
jgi:hypothetical protein